MRDVRIVRACSREEIDKCYAIRMEVFVGEQGVPKEIEIDAQDAACDHFLLLADAPAATARLYWEDEAWHIGRVAVRRQYRGEGYGLALIRFIIDSITQRPCVIEVGSQLQAVPFYEKLGFRCYGEPYEDAGIAHSHMRLKLE